MTMAQIHISNIFSPKVIISCHENSVKIFRSDLNIFISLLLYLILFLKRVKGKYNNNIYLISKKSISNKNERNSKT